MRVNKARLYIHPYSNHYIVGVNKAGCTTTPALTGLYKHLYNNHHIVAMTTTGLYYHPYSNHYVVGAQ